MRDSDAFLVQLDASFAVRWQLSLGSSSADTTRYIARLCDGSPVVVGDYSAEATLVPSGTKLSGAGAWLMRVAP